MFEAIAATVVVSAAVFLPLGALYGHSLAAHASAEASSVKSHVTGLVSELRSDVKNRLDAVAKKV